MPTRQRSRVQRIDRLHARVRSNPAFQRLAIISRILLAVGFIPTGLVKCSAERFNVMGIDNPIGFFIEAMHQSEILAEAASWFARETDVAQELLSGMIV